MTELTDAKIAVWVRFATPELVIGPDLIGEKCDFIFDGYRISVELPSEVGEKKKAGNQLDLFNWREENGIIVPLRYYVHSIDVRVFVKSILSVPNAVLTSNPNPYELVSHEEQARFNQIAALHEAIAERAFEDWVRVMRWKANNGRIARKQLLGPRTGLSSYLEDCATRHRFWAADTVLMLRNDLPVSLSQWNETVNALQNGIRPPIHVDLLFAAQEHLFHDERQRSVVDAAVACEAYMRSRVVEALPVDLSPSIRKFVDESNIRQVVTKFYPDLLSQEDKVVFRKHEAVIHKLFDARNAILHSGIGPDLSLRDCETFLTAVEIITKL